MLTWLLLVEIIGIPIFLIVIFLTILTVADNSSDINFSCQLIAKNVPYLSCISNLSISFLS